MNRRSESFIERAASSVVVVGLLTAIVSAAAAWNWHSIWRAFALRGDAARAVALQAQDRWQHWVGLCLVSLVVAVAARVLQGQRAR